MRDNFHQMVQEVLDLAHKVVVVAEQAHLVLVLLEVYLHMVAVQVGQERNQVLREFLIIMAAAAVVLTIMHLDMHLHLDKVEMVV